MSIFVFFSFNFKQIILLLYLKCNKILLSRSVKRGEVMLCKGKSFTPLVLQVLYLFANSAPALDVLRQGKTTGVKGGGEGDIK